MYVTEPTLNAKCKNDKFKQVTLTSHTKSNEFLFRFSQLLNLFGFLNFGKKSVKLKSQKILQIWPHSVARTNTDNGVLVRRQRIYSSMIRLLVAKKQKFPLTKKSAKLLRIEYIRDFIREPFFFYVSLDQVYNQVSKSEI